jgi:hypothetical protein
MRPLIGILIPLMLVGAVALSGTATALDQPGATSVKIDGAVIASLRRGRSARDAGRWDEARSAFKDALARTNAAPVPVAVRAEIIGEIGICALAQKNHREAAERLAESLSYRSAMSAVLQGRFEDGRRQAEKHIYRLYLGVNRPDAQVFLDGKPISPRAGTYQLFLDPGSHTVRARLIGFGDSENTFDAFAGQQSSLSLKLEPVVQMPTARSVPLGQAGSPTGAGAASQLLPTAGIALTAATAVLGGGALVWAKILDGDIEEDADDIRWVRRDPNACRQPDAKCSNLQDAEERRDLLAGFGVLCLSVSGAMGVVTGALISLADDESPRVIKNAVRVVPLAGPRQAGLRVIGTWW